MLRINKSKGIYTSNTDNSSHPFVLKSAVDVITLAVGWPGIFIFFLLSIFGSNTPHYRTFVFCYWGAMMIVCLILEHCGRCGLVFRFYSDRVEFVIPTGDDLRATILREDRDLNYYQTSGLRLKSYARKKLRSVKMYSFKKNFFIRNRCIILVELQGCKSHPNEHRWWHIVRNIGKVLILDMSTEEAQAAYSLVAGYIMDSTGEGLQAEKEDA